MHTREKDGGSVAVVVVTDSASGLPTELAEHHGVRVVPLHVLHNGYDLREGVDVIPEQVWTSTGSSTSGASPRELQVAYERAVRDSGGGGAVAVHISRHLSSTWDNARQAAKLVGEKVRIVDSAAAGMGQGLVVIAAAQAAARGGDRDEVYETAVAAAGRGSSLLVVDTLDSLRRGGRIGAAAAMLGTALAIKPVLEVAAGKIVVREKLRTATKALDKLVDSSVMIAGTSRVAVAVQHFDAAERAAAVLAQLQARIPNISSSYVTQFGAVLSLHLGRGTLGVSLLPD